MTEVMTVTEAARNFSDVINRVYYQGKSFALVRNGSVVAHLTPPPPALTWLELSRIWSALPHIDPEDADAWAEEQTALRASMELPENPWDS